MITVHQNYERQIFYRDDRDDRQYRRVVGALAWPAPPSKGWLTVVGEDFYPDLARQQRRFYVLAAREAASIPDLHRGCLELRQETAAQLWVADTEDQRLPEIRMFARENRTLEWRHHVLLSTAPFAGRSAGTIAQLLGDLLRPGQKWLVLGDAGYSGQLLALNPDQLAMPAARFPALAALGYAVAELLMKEPVSKNLQKQVVSTWNVYA